MSQNTPKHKPFPTAAVDAGTRTKAAILVFFGGACYGFNATCYKLFLRMGVQLRTNCRRANVGGLRVVCRIPLL